MTRLLLAILIGATTAGCIVDNSTTSTTASPSTTPVDRNVVTTIYFGLSVGDAGDVVPPGEWEAFVSNDIATTLPAGFTIVDATGRWMDHDSVVREPSRLLIVVHDGSAKSSRELDALRETYKKRFKQESVLRVDTPASRVSF